jgi:hypothetical protein
MKFLNNNSGLTTVGHHLKIHLEGLKKTTKTSMWGTINPAEIRIYYL